FPTGISGMALTGRAVHQAQKFGAEVAIPVQAAHLRLRQVEQPGAKSLQLTLGGGQIVNARTVVIASGARYKRPVAKNLAAFEGSGIHYWASAAEATLCTDKEIVLVGGGNSAGQAVAFLAPHVRKISVVIRGARLDQSMSRYLVQRIESLENVEVHCG